MLRYNIQRMIHARGILKPFAFFTKAGFSSTFANKLKNNRVTRLDPQMIERLCLALNCTPNDLMEWEPDEGAPVEEGYALNRIRINKKALNITKTLHSVPLDKLEKIEKLIQELAAD